MQHHGENLATTNPVRWGIIGAGRIAKVFARDMQWVRNGRLVVVSSTSQQRAKAFAQEFSLTKSYSNYSDLVNDPEIDAVYVATPHNFHAAHALLALQHQKAVLCEKPITVSPTECEALQKAAINHQCFLMEAMWTWFLPAIKQAEKWLAEGRIGSLKEVRADFGYAMPFNPDDRTYNKALAGGCVLDMGIYPIALNDLMIKTWCKQVGESLTEPKIVSAYGHLAETGVEDEASYTFQFQSGGQDIYAKLSTAFTTKLPNIAWVIGSKGYIEIPDFWRASTAKLWQGEDCVEIFTDNRQGSGFEFQIAHASQCIRDGKPSDRVTFADSLRWQQQMDQLLKRLKVR